MDFGLVTAELFFFFTGEDVAGGLLTASCASHPRVGASSSVGKGSFSLRFLRSILHASDAAAGGIGSFR
jgi:hypothetical protein